MIQIAQDASADPEWLMKAKIITRNLQLWDINDAFIDEDLSVSTGADVIATYKSFGFPAKFKVAGRVDIRESIIQPSIGWPDVIMHDLRIHSLRYGANHQFGPMLLKGLILTNDINGVDLRLFAHTWGLVTFGKPLCLDERSTSYFLQLLDIPGLSEVHTVGKSDVVGKIITHHLQNGRDPIQCQDDLIEAGYADLATR